jgi:hypothetical protein
MSLAKMRPPTLLPPPFPFPSASFTATRGLGSFSSIFQELVKRLKRSKGCTARDLLSGWQEEGGAVNEAAMLVGAVVSGHYLGVYLLTVYDENVCGVWEGGSD